MLRSRQVCITLAVASVGFAGIPVFASTAPGSYYNTPSGAIVVEEMVSTVAGTQVIDEKQSNDRAFVMASDGVYQVRYSSPTSTWVNEKVSSLAGITITDNADLEDRFWLAAPDGLHEIFYSFAINGWKDDFTVSNQFQKIIDPTDTNDRVWGISNGNVYEVRFSGFWQAEQYKSGNYIDIAQVNAGGTSERFWLASSNSIEYGRFSGPNFVTESVASLTGIRDIETDPTKERVWAATDTGLYEVRWNGSSWVSELRSTTVLDKIELTAFLAGTDYRVWGINGDGVYEIYNTGGDNWTSELRLGTAYTDLALADQVLGVDPRFWGVIADNSSGWKFDAGGDWNDSANWTGLTPNVVGTVARFGNVITAPRTVFSNSAISVSGIIFDNTNKYTLNGTGSVTLDNGSSAATIDVIQGSHEINLPLIVASNATFTAATNCTLSFTGPVTINAGKNVSQNGNGTVQYQSSVTLQNGASLTMFSATHATALNLQGVSTATVVPHFSPTPTLLQLDALSIDPGSKLDLKNNALLVTSTLATIRGLIVSGGIDSTVATSTQDLGYADAGGGNVAVAYTLLGDIDLDLQVTSTDFTAFVAGYGKSAGVNWTDGDFDYSGKVNSLDFNLLAGNFGGTISAPLLGSAVPEPATGAILLFTAAGWSCRRARKA